MVSIVIPFINRIELLLETLDSIKHQEYEDWDCILVDDGSGEDEVRSVLSFIETDSRFRYLSCGKYKRNGANAARNLGAQCSERPYLIFYDSDDLLAPEALGLRIKQTEENPTAQLWIFNMKGFYGEILPRVSEQKGFPESVEKGLEMILRGGVPWQTGSMLWDRSFWQRIGGWNEKLDCFQDYEISFRAYHFNKNIWVDRTHQCYHFYRLGNTLGISANHSKLSYKKKVFIAMLATEQFIPFSLKASHKAFIKKYFVQWTSRHTGIFSPIYFIFKTNFFKSVSRVEFLGWALRESIIAIMNRLRNSINV